MVLVCVDAIKFLADTEKGALAHHSSSAAYSPEPLPGNGPPHGLPGTERAGLLKDEGLWRRRGGDLKTSMNNDKQSKPVSDSRLFNVTKTNCPHFRFRFQPN